MIYLFNMEMLMNFRLSLALAVLVAFAWPRFASAQAPTGQVLKSGEQVYLEACKVCHAPGVGGAPAVGNQKTWAPLIGEGQVPLTVTAWLGIRAMPARGGGVDLSLEEFARATAWMARGSGARWVDPDAAMLTRMRDLEQKRLAARNKLKPQTGS